jgi:hypothetical protein
VAERVLDIWEFGLLPRAGKKIIFYSFIFFYILALESINGWVVLIVIMVDDDKAITNVVDKILLIVLVNKHIIDKCLDII